jgi:hypothetical protein
MLVKDGIVMLTPNEQALWEAMLGRELNSHIELETLRTMGEMRVRELKETGRIQFAQSAEKHVIALPRQLH